MCRYWIVVAALLQLAYCEHLPKSLEWSTNCEEGYSLCGTLEFCNAGAVYGYVLSGQDCVPGPGPILRLIPGNRYKLTLSNKADETTNIHAHGLHISGSGNGDDVTRHVAPGHCISYTWDIGAEHPSGTNWYHAHQHGQTAVQVQGGAFGLLIVEDAPLKQKLPKAIELWQKNEKILVVTGKERQYSRRKHSGAARGNGVLNDQFEFVANEWYRLRVSIVDPDGHPKPLTFGPACTAHLVARDGIWRSTIPAPAATKYELPGSARADFAVQCVHKGAVSPILFDGDVVASINVVAGAQTAASPFDNGAAWEPERSAYLADTLEASVPARNQYRVETTERAINGLEWDARVPHREVAFGEVHEWTLLMTHHHPFHLHVYHMQVATPGGCGAHEYGEWYDTIAAEGACRVRFRSADVGERVVFHCHVLRHEDGGAMGWVDVQGPSMPKNLADGTDHLCAGPALHARHQPVPA
mmetsp:Transcript_9531/g.21890  ORF Transcript_9531/g.21890 Transcript_9531/m.21890 type:complete len:470 (+) Transcript_9531:58-1467(+)